MSKKYISLPGFIIADLYKNSLVIADPIAISNNVLEKKVTPVSETANEKITRQWYLGSNKKNIAILVNDPDSLYLNDESLNFLTSILTACQLNLGDVAIVNMYPALHTEPVVYSFLKQQLAPLHILIFDIDLLMLQLPFSMPNYQVQQYDGCRFLSAPSLQLMLGNSQEAKLEKSKLWLSLKTIFNI